MRVKGLMRRRPLLAYAALTFAISWGGILTLLAARRFDLSPPGPGELGIDFVLMLLGPSVAGITLIAVLDGSAGLRDLWTRCIRWRVGGGWYAVALLTAPVLLLAILLGFGALASPAWTPRFQWPLFGAGLVAGAFEEIGWTGFVTPRLPARPHAGLAGLWLGLVWALWHLLVDFRYNIAAMGGVWPFQFIVVYLAALTPYRLLMTWVYRNTASVMLAVLMHASYTGWLLVLFPAISLSGDLVWQSVFAAILWLAVALVARWSRPDQARRALARGAPIEASPKI